MNQDSWITRSVARWKPQFFKSNDLLAPADSAQAATKIIATAKVDGVQKMPASGPKATETRATRERLQATMTQKGEALSPRALRRVLQELQAVIDGRVSEVEGGRRAAALTAWYLGATAARRHDMWLLMSEQFMAVAWRFWSGCGQKCSRT